MLHRRKSAEVLPVWVFDPTRDGRFIRLVQRMLQKIQADHQSQGIARRTVVGGLAIDKCPVKPLANQYYWPARPTDVRG